jgi:hypothetical protein
VLRQPKPIEGTLNCQQPWRELHLERAWLAAGVEQRREIVRAVVRYVVITPAIRRGAGLDPDRVVIPPDAWKV